MKKLFALLFAILFFVSPMIETAAAIHIVEEDTYVAAIENHMRARGIWGDGFTSDILYDANDEAKYLLGVTSGGYIILERETYVFHECGGGISPYSEYMSAKKYYGGPLCYYIDAAGVNSLNTRSSTAEQSNVYNIVKGTYENTVDTLHFDQDTSTALTNSVSPSSVTINGETRVDSATGFIRRRAFGYNGDNTCSAVATALALNYLTLEHNIPIVASNDLPELLTSGTWPNSSNISSRYPKAHALHRLLVDEYYMHAVSYASDIVAAVQRYAAYEVPDGYNLGITHSLNPEYATMKSKIDADLPILITTTIVEDSALNGHTMIAFGYRTSSGVNELLVHYGWYGSSNSGYMNSTGTMQNEHWVNENYATWAYYFSIS